MGAVRRYTGSGLCVGMWKYIHTKPLGFIDLSTSFIREHIIGLLPFRGNPKLPTSRFITHISPHQSEIQGYNIYRNYRNIKSLL